MWLQFVLLWRCYSYSLFTTCIWFESEAFIANEQTSHSYHKQSITYIMFSLYTLFFHSRFELNFSVVWWFDFKFNWIVDIIHFLARFFFCFYCFFFGFYHTMIDHGIFGKLSNNTHTHTHESNKQSNILSA